MLEFVLDDGTGWLSATLCKEEAVSWLDKTVEVRSTLQTATVVLQLVCLLTVVYCFLLSA